MDRTPEYRFDPDALSTPCFVVDESLLDENLRILKQVKDRSGCRILLALKCFAMPRVFPVIARVLDGVCASSPHEARLGKETFKKEVHTFGAAYSRDNILELSRTTDHLVFNSFNQYRRFASLVRDTAAGLGRTIEFGIRINPEHSEGAVPIYDPCAPGSRLGVKQKDFRPDLLDGITGLHWHNLCEQDADCLERTVRAAEARFGESFKKMKYVNFGGGHHITRPGYNLDLLVKTVLEFQDRWGVRVYLEPGEAVALNAGFLVARVLDIIPGDMDLVIMDASVPAHMPDVIEMPYRPEISGSGRPNEKAWTCRIGGPSCLAGDVAGEYSFDTPLKVGDHLVFKDMAIYSMVKTNTFNGIRLPDINLCRKSDGQVEMVRSFGYSDFFNRL